MAHQQKKILPILLPGLVLLLGAVITVGIFISKPDPVKREVVVKPLNVRAVTAEKTSLTLGIETQGTVRSRQEINLVPQVGGKIIEVSDKFVAGGYFAKGETLVRIDPRDYELALISAKSRVAESRQRLELEKAEAALAKKEWEMLGQGQASDLTLRKPQLADAEARVQAAMADFNQAKINLERTTIKAPFEGLLIQKNVDLGQFVSAGTALGQFNSTDVLEVRLPLSNRDLGHFDFKKLNQQNGKIPVELYGTFANTQNSWQAEIVRTEGIINTDSRIMFVVAELRGDQLLSREDKTPIMIGQFVKARIEGRRFDNIVKLPRSALKQDNKVLVIDKNNRLQTRLVDVIDANKAFVVIGAGLKQGENVTISQLNSQVDGVQVKANFDGAPALAKKNAKPGGGS